MFFSVKDNHWVYCAMKVVIPAVLEKARELGVSVDQIIHKVISVATLLIFLIFFSYLVGSSIQSVLELRDGSCPQGAGS